MKKILTVILMSLGLLLTGILTSTSVEAAPGARFNIEPVYPSNQLDKTLGYFQLKTAPGSTGKLRVTVTNMDKKATRTIKVSPVNATTSDQGQINYTPDQRPVDSSADVRLTDLMSKSVTVKLAPMTRRIVSFAYAIPKAGFTGTVLGSIYATDKTTDEAKNKGFRLNNRFAMALGVSMTTNPKLVISPNFKLGDIKPDILANKPVVVANLRNVAATYFRDMTVNAIITKQGQNDRLYSAKLENGSMAPQSNFNFQIETHGKVIPAGNYTLTMNNKVGDKKWRLTKDFTVSQTDYDKLAARNGEKQPNYWLYWLIGAVVLLVIALLAWFFYSLGKRGGRQHEDPKKRD